MALTLTSSAFEHNGAIPPKYTCDGENLNPPLSISGVPDEAQSLVLIMDDPDVPDSVDVDVWDHWIVFNMPAKDTDIPEGVEPEGVHGIGTSENKDYYGPCPPDGEHRYMFTLSALDTELDLEEGATKKEVREAMREHIIEEVQLIGLYDRS